METQVRKVKVRRALGLGALLLLTGLLSCDTGAWSRALARGTPQPTFAAGWTTPP